MPLWHPEIRIHLLTITSTKPNPLNLLVLPTGCEYMIIPFTLHTFSGYMLHISSYILYLITYILYITSYVFPVKARFAWTLPLVIYNLSLRQIYM